MYSIIQFFLPQESFNKLFIIIIIIIIIKIIKSIGDQKSLWIMNLEENFCGSYESLRRKDRNHEYQDSNDSASIPDSFKALLIGNFTYQNKDMKMKNWSSQWTQFMQLRKEFRTSTWFEPVEVLNFFQASFTQLHKFHSLRRSFLHFISFPQFICDLFQ